MKKEITREYTAHQLWSRELTERVGKILYPQVMEDRGNFFSTSKKEVFSTTQEACTMAIHVQTTFWRVVTDELIALLTAAENRCTELHAEHQATPWYRWRHRRRLQRQHQDQRILQEGYKAAVRVFTNSPPPVEFPEIAEAGAPRKRVNVCEQCGGTGWAGPNPEEEDLCTHCGGSGREPEAAQ